MILSAKYDPKQVERQWYEYWTDHGLFSSHPDGRKPFTVVIPPPNVTGILHMGHMLNETIQDILVRRARQRGENACWVPGTDHASIATEAKVVARLAEKGIKKSDLTREEFLRHAWDWKEEHGGIILKQLRRIGASCDWDRTAFTMDDVRSESVIKVFVDLYKKGLIYRGVRMVNWDPKARTALSDEEVVYEEEHSKLYYLRYRVVEEGSEAAYAIVATTRPETIMGDTAMCINPNDPKNQWLRGKHVVVPLVGRVIPVIEDDYVDIEFGTGCLKVTPAHDVNDYMLGEKHNLDSIDIFNDDGTVSEAAGMYVGMDRFDVRRQIVADLEQAGLLEKVEDYTNNVGISERTRVPIEPKLSMQWFLRMQHFADLALPPVMNDEIKFYPAKYKNTYRHWLENIKDWCISRQLWWGHRIPAYYLPQGGYVVAETAEEALKQAVEQTGDTSLTLADLRQDEDVLDTWFSSWLWPLSLFNGILDPDNEEFKYYYPTSDLVTGPDILFFWVARMIMAGYEYTGRPPFRNVYFTGIVRDRLGRKMSKSLGNSPDPLDLIDRFGADGVRMGIMLSAPAGNDILFDEALCEQGRNFCNKIWNAFRLVKGWKVADVEQPQTARIATEWFAALMQESVAGIEDMFRKYRLNDALMEIYRLFWDEYSNWYLEMVKPAYESPIDRKTYEQTLSFFETLLQQLHPFMPFITEALWQDICPRKDGESIMTAPLALCTQPANRELVAQVGQIKEVITHIRSIRSKNGLSPKVALTLEVIGNELTKDFEPLVRKMANIEKFDYVQTKDDPARAKNVGARFLVGTLEFAVPVGDLIDVAAERAKLEAELSHLEQFLASIRKKLGNEKFVANAPAKVIEMERKKEKDSEDKIKSLKEALQAL